MLFATSKQHSDVAPDDDDEATDVEGAEEPFVFRHGDGAASDSTAHASAAAVARKSSPVPAASSPKQPAKAAQKRPAAARKPPAKKVRRARDGTEERSDDDEDEDDMDDFIVDGAIGTCTHEAQAQTAAMRPIRRMMWTRMTKRSEWMERCTAARSTLTIPAPVPLWCCLLSAEPTPSR